MSQLTASYPSAPSEGSQNLAMVPPSKLASAALAESAAPEAGLGNASGDSRPNSNAAVTLATTADAAAAAPTPSSSATASAPQSATEWVPTPLVRRSTHHYEQDSAEFFGGSRRTHEHSDPPEPPNDFQRTFQHNRRESFNREDQKRLQYGYIFYEEHKVKGFTEAP